MKDAVIILCTCANEQEALQVANALVEARLAACVNVLPSIRSIYRWKGEIETAQEVLLIIKTVRKRFEAVRERIIGLHSYETPEILAVPLADGSDSYLTWLREQV